VLFVATVIFTIGDGTMQVLIAPHLAEQGVATTAIGPLIAGYSGVALVFRFVAGAVYRPQRTFWLVPLGCVLEALAFVLIARTRTTALLALFIGLNGIGFALASTGGLAAIMDVTRGRRAGSMMGWYTGSIGAGYAMSSFLGGWLADAIGIARSLQVLAVVPLVAAVALGAGLHGLEARPAPPRAVSYGGAVRRTLGQFGGAGPLVWVAAVIGLHINLLMGMLMAFFPLYGLAIGISLTQIGLLTGIHSGISSAARFITPPLFRRFEYRRMLPWLVFLGGFAVAAMPISGDLRFLAVVWLVLGLTRGLLRVSSAALATEAAAEQRRGAASSIYLAGLDLGRILGPLVGGVGVGLVGFAPTFVAAGLLFPILYLVLSAQALRRERRGGDGPATAPASR
jgi:MFS family permease